MKVGLSNEPLKILSLSALLYKYEVVLQPAKRKRAKRTRNKLVPVFFIIRSLIKCPQPFTLSHKSLVSWYLVFIVQQTSPSAAKNSF
jgi:hypothetical protein